MLLLYEMYGLDLRFSKITINDQYFRHTRRRCRLFLTQPATGVWRTDTEESIFAFHACRSI